MRMLKWNVKPSLGCTVSRGRRTSTSTFDQSMNSLKRSNRSAACVPSWLGIVAGLLLPVSVQADIFSLDDGSPETWGGTTGGDCLALNHFNTGGQTVVIDQISLCWNPLSSRVSPTLAIYSDPNGDGNPSDLRLLARYLIYIQPGVVILNQSVQNYSIAPTTVTGSFFVGNYLSDTESGFNPTTGIDTTPPSYMGQSWIIENSRGTGLLDLNNPIGTSSLVTRLDTYISGNFIIEAHYSIIPEPCFACLFALGLLGTATFRRSIKQGS
jgi:hypothetical protein